MQYFKAYTLEDFFALFGLWQVSEKAGALVIQEVQT